MADPVTLGLGAAVLVIVALILVLVYHQVPKPRRPPRSVASAFHRLLLGDDQEAREILSEAIQDPQAPPEAFLHLGNLLRKQGRPERALSLHQGILARPRMDASMRRLVEVALADDLLALGRVEEAQGRLSRMEKHFLDESLLERHALALHRLGRHADAAEVWVRRARLDQKPAHARQAARYLGELAREEQLQGRSETARRWARQARKLDPTVATSAAVEGDIQLADGRAEEAFAAWMEGLETGGEGRETLLPRLLDLALRLGRVDTWLDRLERARAQHPEDPLLWRAVTDLRLRRGDREPFFALVESPPVADAAPLPTWAGWIRYLQGSEDEEGLRRLLLRMPDALGPRQWACAQCGGTAEEPLRACFHCGVPEPMGAVDLATFDPPIPPVPALPQPLPRLPHAQ